MLKNQPKLSINQSKNNSNIIFIGPYTIFVPTDQAIQDYMNPNDQEMLTKNMTLLKQALSYHALDGTLMSSSLQDNQALKTLAGAPLRVNKFTKPDGSTVSIQI